MSGPAGRPRAGCSTDRSRPPPWRHRQKSRNCWRCCRLRSIRCRCSRRDSRGNSSRHSRSCRPRCRRHSWWRCCRTSCSRRVRRPRCPRCCRRRSRCPWRSCPRWSHWRSCPPGRRPGWHRRCCPRRSRRRWRSCSGWRHRCNPPARPRCCTGRYWCCTRRSMNGCC